MSEHGSGSPGSPEDRVDLTGLSRLSERPPPPRGEAAVRIVRALSILLLAVAAAGLPWYFVTRSSNDDKAPPQSRGTSSSPSSSPSPSPSASAGTYEVFGVENCVNFRAEPSTTSKRLDCLIPGIRLQSDGQTQQAEGRLWRHVTYEKNSVSGWIADQYLKPV